jgi:hypothetical protein
VSKRLNESDPVNRFAVRFALVELWQEILQVTHFLDVVLESCLTFSIGKQTRNQ